jgi:flagellar export protein FliJ
MAAQHETTAARDFARSRQDLQVAETRLTELRAARAQYLLEAERAEPGRQTSIRRFLAQLDGVILQLEWQAQRKRVAQERQRQAWTGKHLRTKALGEVTHRAREAERADADNRTERELIDQFARRLRLPH